MIFDSARWVIELELGKDICLCAISDVINLNEWRISDNLGDVVIKES
jgi:hypothetical protein